jgi:hypothetical protein
MPYLKIKQDGSTVTMGQIVGYRVIYKNTKTGKVGRLQYRDPKDPTHKLRDLFTMFWKANTYAKNLPMGAGARVVPVYTGDLSATPAAS